MPSKSSETLSFRSKTYREDGNHIKACLVGCRWCRAFKFLFIICGYITTAIIWNDRRGNRRGNLILGRLKHRWAGQARQNATIFAAA